MVGRGRLALGRDIAKDGGTTAAVEGIPRQDAAEGHRAAAKGNITTLVGGGHQRAGAVGEVGKPPRAVGVVVAVAATELGGVMGIGRVGTDAGEIHVDAGVVVIATAVAGKIGCNGFVPVGGG